LSPLSSVTVYDGFLDGFTLSFSFFNSFLASFLVNGCQPKRFSLLWLTSENLFSLPVCGMFWMVPVQLKDSLALFSCSVNHCWAFSVVQFFCLLKR
jgi:hypothetical protein